MKLAIALVLLASTASASDWQGDASDAYTDAYETSYGVGFPQARAVPQTAVRPWKAKELSQPAPQPQVNCVTYELNGFFYSSCF